jgi:DNA-binding transcriptional MerR regulator
LRISELSRRSGTAIPTIKYYIREGLLPGGTTTAPNQAKYEDRHLARLELVRSLREVADLGIPTIGRILQAVDRVSARGVGASHLPLALRALSPGLIVPRGMERVYAEAEKKVDALVKQLGWRAITRQTAGRADLVRALVGIGRYWRSPMPYPALAEYGKIAERLAHLEIPDDWNPAVAPADTLRYAVLGTVLFEPVILALRRMAHAARSRRLTRALRSRTGQRASSKRRRR